MTPPADAAAGWLREMEDDVMVMVRVYNYPWAGRLGRIAKCCLYCGGKGPAWRISSFATRCLDEGCPYYAGKPPVPELEEKYKAECLRRARDWCVRHGLDHGAVAQELWEQHGGPPNQERGEA